MSLYVVKAVIVLESTGQRLVAKYFVGAQDTLHNVKEQENFEKKLHKKTSQQNAEVIVVDDNVIVYKVRSDVTLCIVADSDENELFLLAILNTFKDTLDILLNSQTDKQRLLENLDYLLLTIDELVDGGVFMESEAQQIANRVALKGLADDDDDLGFPIAEQTVNQVVNEGVSYAKYLWNAFTH